MNAATMRDMYPKGSADGRLPQMSIKGLTNKKGLMSYVREHVSI